ncbi:ABC transporter permease [Desulfosporosinus sp. PR]|uniref:ABC transporter permease n=1 Tax=Candidatus Desulfosporosinus nitrosoreducens TaxID=3401928 RepID=UPI0027E9613D|nr:ABC transporter permease [Desulfosporosinus sp. PR]MDQ7095726.1 ABC transporter permease [Desulfosporosinus sp. PR]
MLKMIALEFRKWKRSKILFGAVAATLIGPFVAAASAYAHLHNAASAPDWASFFAITLQVNLSLLFPILFGALTAYTFVQEYQDRTIINLFTLPESRVKILLAKMIAVLGTLLTLIIVSLLFTLIGGKLMLSAPLTMPTFLRLSGLTLITGVMVLCFIPVFAYIGIRSRHFIPPLVGATGFTLLNFSALVSPTYGPLVPTSIPVFYLLNAIGWRASIPYVWSMLLPIFALSLLFCLREYASQDIH